jgi:hypothetical protein
MGQFNDDDDMTFEQRVASEIMNYALDLLEVVQPEDKDDVLVEIFTDIMSGLLVAYKITNPNFADASILNETFHKIRASYQSRTATTIFAANPKELN